MKPLLDTSSLTRIATSTGGSPIRLANGLMAYRHGRKDVWRIETPAYGTVFVKVCRSQADFERERLGLDMAEAMAGRNDRFLAARRIQADPAHSVVVATRIAGKPVSALIRDGYRIDRNPLFRAAPRMLARCAVCALLAWLEAFRLGKPDDPSLLHDHSYDGIALRINHKLEQQHRDSTFARALGIEGQLLPPPSQASPVLQFGDVSMENFYFDGRRIGAIDFEDIGFGIPGRDHVILRARLARALSLPYYFSDPELLAVIPEPSPLDQAIVRTELDLLRYEREALEPAPIMRWRLDRHSRRVRCAAASCPGLVVRPRP